MARTTIITGALLIVLGVIGAGIAVSHGAKPITALIPAFFGIVFVALGALALKESLKKHAMHGASVLALLGSAMPAFMVIKTLVSGNIERPLAVGLQAVMAVICGVFLVLCVRSFIAAKKARLAAAKAQG